MRKLSPGLFVFTAVLLAAVSPAFAAAPANIVFLSDLGLEDDSVAQCKAAMYEVNPEARIIDMTHQIEPFDIRFAAFILADSAAMWPAGTVFVAVVDPGVGTSRKRLAIKTKNNQYLVGPDNGIFSVAIKKHGVEKAVYIENLEFARNPVSSTFEGRDVFSPVGAWLSKDATVMDRLGKKVGKFEGIEWKPPVLEESGLKGSVLHVEKPYGNVWTDIDRKSFSKTGIVTGSNLKVVVSDQQLTLPLTRTFGDVQMGAMLAYFNSRGLLSFAVNKGDFSRVAPLYEGKEVLIQTTQTDLVNVGELPGGSLKMDMRYSTENNFAKKILIPFSQCILRRDAAEALIKASEFAGKAAKPFSICVMDCYRPLSVQKVLWGMKPDEQYFDSPAKGSMSNRGMAVDVTACDGNGREMEMPSAFDDFSAKAKRNSHAKGKAAANSKALEDAMVKAGFIANPDKWWNYEFPGLEAAPVLDITFTNED